MVVINLGAFRSQRIEVPNIDLNTLRIIIVRSFDCANGYSILNNSWYTVVSIVNDREDYVNSESGF